LKIEESIVHRSISDVASLFTDKVNTWKQNKYQERQRKIDDNRAFVFSQSSEYFESVLETLENQIPEDVADIMLEKVLPEDTSKYFWFTHQIINYAKKYDYFFNKSLPRGWFCFDVRIRDGITYGVIITIHHYGYDDSTIAVGGILETKENENENEKSYSAINLEPYTLSLEIDDINTIKNNLITHLQQLITLGFAEIINELK
jgi:hypothetical protein